MLGNVKCCNTIIIIAVLTWYIILTESEEEDDQNHERKPLFAETYLIVIVLSLFYGLGHVNANTKQAAVHHGPQTLVTTHVIVNGLVRCQNNNKTVSLRFCYCMAYNEHYNTRTSASLISTPQ